MENFRAFDPFRFCALRATIFFNFKYSVNFYRQGDTRSKYFSVKIFSAKIFWPKIVRPTFFVQTVFRPKCFFPKLFSPKFIYENVFFLAKNLCRKLLGRKSASKSTNTLAEIFLDEIFWDEIFLDEKYLGEQFFAECDFAAKYFGRINLVYFFINIKAVLGPVGLLYKICTKMIVARHSFFISGQHEDLRVKPHNFV